MEELTGRNWNKYLKNGYRIFLGTGAGCPHALINLFLRSAKRFSDLEFVYLLSLGESPWLDPAYEQHLHVNTFFLDQGSREAVRSGKADYTPCFLSEIPALLQDNILPIDIAFIQVSPPDAQGYCSLGVSVDIVKSAAKSAKYILAQINDQMPRTFGQCYLHQDEIAAFIRVSEPLPEVPPTGLDDTALQIGKYVSMLIEDGCTLQVGIGKIPDAVLHQLTGHNDLGVHTEMFSDGLLRLYDNGNISNRLKGVHEGKTITSFCYGSQKLYEFVDNNPHVEFHPTEYVNNPAVIARNNKMISLTSATQIDLTGQIVSDTVGGQFYSGIGGQVDFIRGAGMSRGGRPIIALPSTARNGTVSRIVSELSRSAGVVATRGDVHYVVTEYGIATLRGRSIRERVMELIQVAHPKFRAQLLEDMLQSGKVPSYQRSTPAPVKELGDTEVIKLDIQGNDYFLRPLRPSDQLRLQNFFYSHNTATLFQRYRNEPKKMGTARAYRLVNTDLKKDMALCIVERQGPREVILAVGRYYTSEAGRRAEVAFVVHENQRGRGFATRLLEKLIDIARQRRVQLLTGNVRKDNPSMRRVFEKFSFTSIQAQEPAELEYQLHLSAEEGPGLWLALQHKFPVNPSHFQLFSHPDCLLHEVGEEHPETPARLSQVLRSCAALPDQLPLSLQLPPPARVAQLERVHEKDYLMRLKIACIRSEPSFMAPDNRIGANSFRAVLAAGGCALALGETLLSGGAGFALVRPPGHHAGRRSAEGFCFINHAALTIETIRLQQPEATFLVVDFDVHHGNGIDSLYAEDPRVSYFSLHGPPDHIFPNTGYTHETGRGAGEGSTRNITLALKSSGDDWLRQFEDNLVDFAKQIRPGYLLVNAGFDAHREDPFGLMNVEDRHYLQAIRLLQELADERCAGRLGLFLEGGYAPAVLQRLLPEIITQLALKHAKR